jgi:hypothetical protein
MMPIIAALVAAAAAVYVYYQYGGDLSGVLGGIITMPDQPTDTSSAPSVPDISSKVQQWAQAIAHAEGFGISGAVPTTHHNPGDLGPGDTGYPGDAHSGSIVSVLPSDDIGWAYLYGKLNKIIAGNSSVYSIQMTWVQFAQKYAGDWQHWAVNVANQLGVNPNSRIVDWLYS